MGENIRVTFQSEHDWERTRAQWIEDLLAVGALFGDDESLMRAKADCVHQLLRRIVEDIPAIRITAKLPDGVPPEQIPLFSAAVREAALKGIEASMNHSVRLVMAAIFDLCTSKLRREPS
jgi:hypothetical protein